MFSKKATKTDEIFTPDLTLVKSMVKISSIFVAFFENMNFKSGSKFQHGEGGIKKRPKYSDVFYGP